MRAWCSCKPARHQTSTTARVHPIHCTMFEWRPKAILISMVMRPVWLSPFELRLTYRGLFYSTIPSSMLVLIYSWISELFCFDELVLREETKTEKNNTRAEWRHRRDISMHKSKDCHNHITANGELFICLRIFSMHYFLRAVIVKRPAPNKRIHLTEPKRSDDNKKKAAITTKEFRDATRRKMYRDL